MAKSAGVIELIYLKVSLGEDLLAYLGLVGGAKGLLEIVPLGGLALGHVGKHGGRLQHLVQVLLDALSPPQYLKQR